MEFDDKYAVVAGASTGIGRAIAVESARKSVSAIGGLDFNLRQVIFSNLD